MNYEPLYLDNAATTRTDEDIAECALRLMTENYGNPSSLHGMGVKAEKEIRQAKENVASLLGCEPEEIIFTGSGTEANNLALLGAYEARKRRGDNIVSTTVEHPSVSNVLKHLSKDIDVRTISPGSGGVTDFSRLMSLVDEKTAFVSMMYINNQTGLMLPVLELAKRIKERFPQCIVHCDGVQAAGKLPVKLKGSGIDLFSMSGHKLHAPKGIGALYKSRDTRIVPILHGGGQQTGLRPGTEPVPLIGALGLAAKNAQSALEQSFRHVSELKDRLKAGLMAVNGVKVHDFTGFSPYILGFSVTGRKSEVMLHTLEREFIYVSSGSACARGKVDEGLLSQGITRAEADSFLRISFSRYNKIEDVDRLLSAVKAL